MPPPSKNGEVSDTWPEYSAGEIYKNYIVM